MVEEIEGVVNEVPVPNKVPPLEAENQLIVPAEGLAPKFTVPLPQLLPGVVETVVGIELIEIEVVEEY